MYKIGIKHNGAIIATTDLLVEEVKKLEVSRLVYIIDIFEKKFGLDISEYRLNEYENNEGNFFIHIRNEDLQRLREDKLKEIGI
jgi:hypothetical protein